MALDKDFELEELKELACEGSTAVKPNSRMGLNDRRKVSRSSFERESGQQAAYRAVHRVKAELERDKPPASDPRWAELHKVRAKS